MGIAHHVLEQPIALSHGLFVGQRDVCVGRLEAEGDTVKETPSPIRALDPKAIHGRNQPKDTRDPAQRGLTGRLAVNPCLAALIRLGPCFDLVALVQAGQIGCDFPPVGSGCSRECGRRCPAQPAPGRQQRNCFEDVGLSGSIGAGNRDRPGLGVDRCKSVAAKLSQLQRRDGKGGQGWVA